MKVLLVFALSFAIAATIPIEESTEGWFVPQLDGSFEWITREKWGQFQRKTDIFETNHDDIIYYLYTRSNPESRQTLINGNVYSLQSSNFNSSNPTSFIIHGWVSNADTDLCYSIRDSFLAIGNYNVICVDWSYKAVAEYTSAVLSVPGVGKRVANMIDFLHKNGGMSFKDLLVAGHSLGAHVSGFAGKHVKYGRIHQITAMDPAYPLYSYSDSYDRLNINDAVYVESIQTNGGVSGFLEPIGRGTFYPNGGQMQPGCIDGGCSHARSYQYYAVAILGNNFPTMKCENYLQALLSACGNTYSGIYMGASTNYINAIGSFYVPVIAKPPYTSYMDFLK